MAKKDAAAEIVGFVKRYTQQIAGYPQTHEPLVVIEMDDGQRKPAEINKSQELTAFSEKNLYQYFLRYIENQCDGTELITPQRAKQIAEYWLATTKPIKFANIASFRFRSEPGFTWKRLDFDPKPGPTPTWDELCSRIGNVDAFKAFTGSLFYEKTYLQQYLVLYGAAGSGKGSYLQMLEHCFGDAMMPCDQSPRSKDKHYFASIYNSRIVFFDDFDDPAAFSCPRFKMATGGSEVPVDPKGQARFKAKMNARWIFTMNECPEIELTDSDTRRGIICKVAKATEKREIVDDLVKELAAIVHQCMQFRLLTPLMEPIKVDQDSFDDVTELNYTSAERFWAKYFIINKNAYVTSSQVVDCFLHAGISCKREWSKYYKWLEENTGATRGRLTDTGRTRVLKGIAKREIVSKNSQVTEDNTKSAVESFWTNTTGAVPDADQNVYAIKPNT